MRNIKGTLAEVVVDDSDRVIVSSLISGNSYFKLVDHRGTTASLDVFVIDTYDLLTDKINIVGINDQVINVLLKHGEGDWELLNPSQESPLIDFIKVHSKTDLEKKYNSVQINTAKEGKGSIEIQLKNKKGDIASIVLTIE